MLACDARQHAGRRDGADDCEGFVSARAIRRCLFKMTEHTAENAAFPAALLRCGDPLERSSLK